MATQSEGVTPTPRPASRVLVFDPHDRLLLLNYVGDFEDGPSLWVPPGGGLQSGETFEEAAARELWEETGMVFPIGPHVWTRRHRFRFQGVLYQAHERYFIVRAATTEVSNSHWEPFERAAIAGYRWWSVEEITASDEVFDPRTLAALLPPLLTQQEDFVPAELDI